MVQKIVTMQEDIEKKQKGTFQKIINNIFCLIENDIIEKIDIRINFDKQNISFIPELFDLFVDNKIEKRISLSFGIITPTIYINTKNYFEENTLGQTINAEKYLWLCSEAKKEDFLSQKNFYLVHGAQQERYIQQLYFLEET